MAAMNTNTKAIKAGVIVLTKSPPVDRCENFLYTHIAAPKPAKNAMNELLAILLKSPLLLILLALQALRDLVHLDFAWLSVPLRWRRGKLQRVHAKRPNPQLL